MLLKRKENVDFIQ